MRPQQAFFRLWPRLKTLQVLVQNIVSWPTGFLSFFIQSNCSFCRAAEHSLQHTSCESATENTNTKISQCAKLMAYLHKTSRDVQIHPAPHHTHQSTFKNIEIFDCLLLQLTTGTIDDPFDQ